MWITLRCKFQRGASSWRMWSRHTESAPPDTATPARWSGENMWRRVMVPSTRSCSTGAPFLGGYAGSMAVAIRQVYGIGAAGQRTLSRQWKITKLELFGSAHRAVASPGYRSPGYVRPRRAVGSVRARAHAERTCQIARAQHGPHQPARH